ncbi:thymidylate synthase [Elysia marginata]|uniref:Thymidylate synthase n=1 Tax=Elysia marginata TaxID=1093978 RepID=A0AAV4FZU0_9GAST|nr:thymidylate synthase [Elysia marginata]
MENITNVQDFASEKSKSPKEQDSQNSNSGGRHDEQQYLDAIREIIEKGSLRSNRTGIDTKAIFGMQHRYNLRESFPLLTTKRVFWRGILEELLWFIRGSTSSPELEAKGVNIWKANGSREFLDAKGLNHREEGDLGPVYGFQWRHFGAEYQDMHTDYSEQGVDQLKSVIEKIRNKPNDRTIIVCAWNAKVPFNIASYALLTVMIAHITGLKPGDFVHTMGDAHVYVNHIEPLREQLKRTPRPFPKLTIKRKVTDIEDFTADDFEIVGYKPHPKIQMDMAV